MVSKAVAVAVAAMHAQGGGGNGGGGGAGGRVIKDKVFSNVRKFDQDENLWEDCAYDFKVALSTQSPEMKKTFEDVENYLGNLDAGTVISLNAQRSEKPNIKQRAAEIFQILVFKTNGEAKLMVKTVEGQDGIRAWQKLHKHHHRRTFAKSIRDHREILYPKPLKHMGEVVAAATEWEGKVTKV